MHWTEKTFVEDASVFRRNLELTLEAADEEVTDLLGLCADHGVDPSTVLDVACGIGRHAVELADRGVAVHGVDLSPPYVREARERAVERGVADETMFVAGDMRDLPVAGSYDLVTNMWTSFGYYDDETNEAVAAALRERVAPGGALVMDVSNREGTLAEYASSAVHRGEGYLHTEEREYDPETARMETTVTVFDDDGEDYDLVGEMTWDLRVYAPVELRRLLERAGFGDVSLYGGLDGSDLERDSRRLVAVAEP